MIIELHLHIGARSFPHLSLWRMSKLYLILQLLASLGLYLAISGIIYSLWPWALVIFVIASVISLFVLFRI